MSADPRDRPTADRLRRHEHRRVDRPPSEPRTGILRTAGAWVVPSSHRSDGPGGAGLASDKGEGMSSPAVSRHRLVDRPRHHGHGSPRRRCPAPPTSTRRRPPASPAGTATTGAPATGGGRRRCSPSTACRPGRPSRTPRRTCSTSTPRTARGCSRPSPQACATGEDFALETRIIRADGAGAGRRPGGRVPAPTTTGGSPPSRAWPSTSPSATRPGRPPSGPRPCRPRSASCGPRWPAAPRSSRPRGS